MIDNTSFLIERKQNFDFYSRIFDMEIRIYEHFNENVFESIFQLLKGLHLSPNKAK